MELAPLGIVAEVGSAAVMKASSLEPLSATVRATSSSIPRLSSNSAGLPSVTGVLTAVMDTVDRSSSSIVPVALAAADSSPLTGPLSVTVNVSGGSSTSSGSTATVTVVEVVPLAMVSVPPVTVV